MIDIDYKQLGFLKSKAVWFAEQLPAIKGYHIIYCYSCCSKLSCHYRFAQETSDTVLIDLSLDADKLFGLVLPRRRQRIRRAYKEKIQITHHVFDRNLIDEFTYLYRKFQVPRGYYFPSP
jgi:hypothetical protein